MNSLPTTPSTASILVVDDEPDLRTLYELTLLREGYRVETAGTVHEAMEQLQQRRFDVMISDMRLPDGNGMQLLLQLREQARLERCIVMTAYGSAENAVEALRAGAFDYLTKPVRAERLRQALHKAVTALAMQQEAFAMPPATHMGPAPAQAAAANGAGATAGFRDCAAPATPRRARVLRLYRGRSRR